MSTLEENDENEKRFNEIMARTNSRIREETARLMDAHHDSIQHSRYVIQALRDFESRYEDIISNVIIAHSIAAKEIADLYGDVLAGELGIEEAVDEEEEGGEVDES